MKYLIGILVVAWAAIGTAALAFVVEEHTLTTPYETYVVSASPEAARVYLGELTDYPEMYEITSSEPFELRAVVRQSVSETPAPFALIAVRQDDRGGGVSEIARLIQPVADWREVSDSFLGMRFLESEPISVPVAAGTYRVEISTPENSGRYWLQLGAAPERAGIFSTLGHIRTVQQHFGLGWWRFFWAGGVFYPLGALLLLSGIYATWRFRARLFHVA
jgi:hypothetical protein